MTADRRTNAPITSFFSQGHLVLAEIGALLVLLLARLGGQFATSLRQYLQSKLALSADAAAEAMAELSHVSF